MLGVCSVIVCLDVDAETLMRVDEVPKKEGCFMFAGNANYEGNIS